MKRRSVVALVLAPALAVGGLTVPVLGSLPDSHRPVIDRDPVRASVTSIPISGIDTGVVDESTVAMASWDSLVGGTEIGELGLGESPAFSFTEDEHAHHEHAHDEHVEALEPAIAARAESVEPFSLVGVTSQSPFEPGTRVLVRVLEGDTWSTWEPLTITDHGPDPGSTEASGIRFGTDPLLTDTAEGVQVRIDTPGGDVPEGAEVMLVDNPVVEEDGELPAPADGSAIAPVSVAQASTAAVMPTIISRAEWGADESLRRGSPQYAPTIKAAFVHHTASRNNYTPEQAAKQVRNLYSYFTKGLRYSDMGYNFLVDRFGRLYEGRAGGLDQSVVGGHTAGFNDSTFAISAIGNFHKETPPADQMAAIVDSISSLTAWKLAMNHRDPNGTITLVSDSDRGTSRYRPGEATNALVIGGHGDIGKTSCPGRHLEPQLPAIRAATTAKMGAGMYNPTANPSMWASGPMSITATTNAPLVWTIAISNGCGQIVRNLGGQQDAPGPVQIDWDQRDDAGNQVPPGMYTVSMSATAGGQQLYPWVGAGRVLATPASPPDPCGAPESFTLTGAGFGHGVGMSQYGALAMAKAGMDATSIVTHYYQGTSVTPVQDDMPIRVNLEYQKKHVQIRGEAVEGDGTVQANLGGNVVTAGPGESFYFTGESGAVQAAKIVGGARQELGVFPSASLTWSGIANVIDRSGNFESPGHRYRYGVIEITPIGPSAQTRLNAVNVLRVRDEYLYGIAEVSSSWPDAALQAQVLAARTYALSSMASGVKGACNCHVDDGYGPYSDQVFAGWAKQSGPQGNRWVNAVNATHASPNTGLAIVFEGKPIRAFYSSSNGGASQASVDQWGGDLPYVRSVADPWSLSEDNPNRSWTVTVSQADMAQAFGVGEVHKIDIVQRDPSGVARTVQATLADGSTVTRSGNQLRNALGLKSSYINAVDGSAGVPVTTPQAPSTPAAPAQPTVTYERQVQMLTPVDRQVKALKSFTIRAKVTPARKGLRVWFQRLDAGEWTTIKKIRTKANGSVAYQVPEAWPPNTTQEYRVVVVRKKQPIGVGETFRVSVVPSVKGRSVALVSPQTMDVPAGQSFTIRATVAPGRKGLEVWRQALVDGEWRTVQRATTKKGGRVVFRVKKAAPAGARYTYRLLVVAKRQAAGASPDITVNVVP
ncbi:MAG: SpoIID/LytB domain-containing protein [Candidatus Nanopelagicales bacterium]